MVFFQLNRAPVFQELLPADDLGGHDGVEGGTAEFGRVVARQVQKEPFDVDVPAAADGEDVGGGGPELGQEEVQPLLRAEGEVPPGVEVEHPGRDLFAVCGADE